MCSIRPAFCLGLLAAVLPVSPAAACSVAVSGVPFGAYDTLSPSPTTAAALLELECRRASVDPEVEFGPGLSGSYAAREMSGGIDALEYNLYTDATYSIVWGDGSGGTATVFPPRAQGRTFRTTIYGRIPAGQNVRAGTYTDTIFVTVNF